jgi:hypothetical protein
MMSVLSEGFAGWFRSRSGDANAVEPQTGATATTGGSVDQEPVVVWVAPNQMEAQIVKGRLESAGIPAIIRGEVLGAIFGLTTGSLAESVVLVPAALADKAEALLQSDESLDAEDAGQAE